EREEQWRQDHVLKIMGERQWLDWRDLRLRDLSEPEVARKLVHNCGNIVEALRQPWISLEEQRAQEERQRQEAEAAARAKAEQERLTREAEEQHLFGPQLNSVIQQRIAREAEEQRRAEEAARLARDAELQRQAEAGERQRISAVLEARKQAKAERPER